MVAIVIADAWDSIGSSFSGWYSSGRQIWNKEPNSTKSSGLMTKFEWWAGVLPKSCKGRERKQFTTRPHILQMKKGKLLFRFFDIVQINKSLLSSMLISRCPTTFIAHPATGTRNKTGWFQQSNCTLVSCVENETWCLLGAVVNYLVSYFIWAGHNHFLLLPIYFVLLMGIAAQW